MARPGRGGGRGDRDRAHDRNRDEAGRREGGGEDRGREARDRARPPGPGRGQREEGGAGRAADRPSEPSRQERGGRAGKAARADKAGPTPGAGQSREKDARRGGSAEPGGRGGDSTAEPAQPSIAVGATANKPELLETVPIVNQPGKGRRVVLSLGPETKTETPLPDLVAGDRLLAFAELELTTDAEDPNHPGLVGSAYSYSPNVEATLLLAADADAVEPKQGRAIELTRAPWRQAVSHQRHHAVVTFGDAELRVPSAGLGWEGPAHVNLVVSASHPDAGQGDVLLVGQNEKTPTVVQDMAGIRVVRFRPAETPEPAPESESSCLCAGVPIAKQATVVLSHELAGLEQGEQILVRGRLVTDATGLASAARISTRLFLADQPAQTEPGGTAAGSVTWKGHLSKFTGFNCLPDEGPQTSAKYGVATVRSAPGRSLYVNLVAVSAAPFGGIDASAQLRIDTAKSGLRVTRFRP